MGFVKNFVEINKDDISIAGGKGASLGEMTQAGISVPPGFVILSNAFEKFFEADEVIRKFAESKWHFIHKRTRSPLYTSLLWEGAHFKTKTDIPFDYSIDKFIYFDTEIAVDEQSWEKLQSRIINFTKENPNALSELLRQNYKINETVKRFAESTQKQSLSPQNLIKLWKKYRSLMHGFGAYTLLPLFIEADLEKELRSAVLQKYGEQAEEVYQVLTTSLKSGATQEEEISLLRLAVLKLKNQLRASHLDKHLNKFSWITNNTFNGKFMKRKELEQRVKQVSKDDPKRHLENYISKNEILSKLFEKYYKSFSSNKRIQGVIDVLQESIFFRSWRTERYYCNAYYMQNFFNTSAKMLGFKDLTNIFYLTIAEIVEALENKNLPKNIEISERKAGYICFAAENKVFVCQGEKLKEAKQHIRLQTFSKNMKEVKGQTAYPGKVSGHVSVVITKDDLKNVKDGAVLVSPSTTVDYVPVLKRVIAIVAEEGGVLSHASVISRELHIPCIIGTKNATQVLKDGDFVEVDANHGVVKNMKIIE